MTLLPYLRPELLLLMLLFTLALGCQETVQQVEPAAGAASFEQTLSQLEAYRRSDQDSADWYAGQLEGMLPHGSQQQQLDGYAALGRAAHSAGRYEAAIAHFRQAANLAETLEATGRWAKLLSRQGNARTMQGELAQALELQDKALRLCSTSEGLEQERAFILQGLAYAYQKGEEPRRAIPYLEEALAYYRSRESWRGVVYTTNLLQMAWSEADSLERAQRMLEQLLHPPTSDHLTAVDSGLLLNNLGRLHNMKGEYKEAAKVLRQAVSVKEQLNNPDSYAKTLVEQMTSLKQAEQWADCIQLAQKVPADEFGRLSLYTRRDWFKQLSRCYAGAGRMKEAYEARLKYEMLYDSVSNLENRDAIRAVELRLAEEEQARLEQAEKIARQQRNLTLVASSALLIAALFSFLLWRNRQRKNAEVLAVKAAELEKNDHLRKRLFTNISHELRTPLTFIQASLQELFDTTPSAATRKWLDSAQHGTRQLQRLIDQILDLSRLEAGKLQAEYTTLAAQPFFCHLTENWQPPARAKGIHLQLDYQLPEALSVELDEAKVEQIVNNLLSNALKFTPAGGRVSLSVSSQDGELSIAVSDNGRGVPESQLPYIFDRFFSVRPSEEANVGGAGIGLSFSRELALLLGGSLEVQSQPGQGSTFECRLPLCKSTSSVAGPSAPCPLPISVEPSAAVEPPAATLLLAEDNPDMQRFLQQVLGKEYRLISAYDGAEALRVLQASDEVDLLISDMMMPEMDGLQLLKKLKSQEKWLGLPIIMLTARVDEQKRLQALSVGVDDYLTKPFHTKELRARVTNLLRFQKLRQANKTMPRTAAPSDISASDWAWLKATERKMLAEIQTPHFSINRLAQDQNLSERQFYRRIKSITGLTPNRYFRELRLHHAKQLLETGACQTVAEVSYAIGIETPEYFSKKYRERFGKRPIEYFK